jgi:hypothetical protein
VKSTAQLKIQKNPPPTDGFNVKTHPFVEIQGMPEGDSYGGYLSAEYASQGDLSTGYSTLAIPLESGGSGGVFSQIFFARAKGASQFTYAGHIDSGGHLGVVVTHGSIVARMPDYGPNDPNCCPSKFLVQIYTIANGKLHKVSEKTIPAPPPEARPGATPNR